MLKQLLLFNAAAILCAATVYGEMLNEKWILSETMVLADNDKICAEKLELTFKPDGEFKLEGQHVNGCFTYGSGRYHLGPEGTDVFVQVISGGYDWPTTGPDAPEPLYWAQVLGGYPLYFKIIDRDATMVAVSEYVNFYTADFTGGISELYNPAPLWEIEGDTYRLIAPANMPMRPRSYQIVQIDD